MMKTFVSVFINTSWHSACLLAVVTTMRLYWCDDVSAVLDSGVSDSGDRDTDSATLRTSRFGYRLELLLLLKTQPALCIALPVKTRGTVRRLSRLEPPARVITRNGQQQTWNQLSSNIFYYVILFLFCV